MLTYNFTTNLAPKLDYLECTLSLPADVLRERIVRLPALLGYSLRKRYQPRVALCDAAGLPPDFALDRMAWSGPRFTLAVETNAAEGGGRVSPGGKRPG